MEQKSGDCLTKQSSDFFRILFPRLENDALHLLSRTCRFFGDSRKSKGFAGKELAVRWELHEIIEKQWGNSAIIKVLVEKDYRPDINWLYRLAAAAPSMFRHLLSCDNAQLWIIAALNADLKQLKKLLGDDLNSAKDVYYDGGVPYLLLMTGAWTSIINLLNQKKILVTDFKWSDTLELFATVGGHRDYSKKLRDLATLRDEDGNYKILSSEIRVALEHLEMPQERKYFYARRLVAFGYLEESLSFIKQEKLDIETLKEKFPTLHLDAAENNHWKVCDRLISHHGFDVNAEDDIGSTLLNIAAFTNQKQRFIKLVEEYNLDPTKMNINKCTPMTFAVMGGAISIVDLCVNNKWDNPHRKLPGGIDTISLAIKEHRQEMLKHLINEYRVSLNDSRLNENHLMQCAEHGNYKAFNFLRELKFFYDVDLTNLDDTLNQTLPMIAAFNGCVHFYDCFINDFGKECLLNIDEDLDDSSSAEERLSLSLSEEEKERGQFRTDYFGNTMLHFACFSKNIHLVHLVKKHYDISFDTKNDLKETPLHYLADGAQEREGGDENVDDIWKFILKIADEYGDYLLDIPGGKNDYCIRDLLPERYQANRLVLN